MTGKHYHIMGEMKMKFETVLTAIAMVVVGAIAIWITFGPLVVNAFETIVNVL